MVSRRDSIDPYRFHEYASIPTNIEELNISSSQISEIVNQNYSI